MMSHQRNPRSILYLLFAWFLGSCYGFVLLSSAAGQNGDFKLFDIGDSLSYDLHSAIYLREKSDDAKPVGFYITGLVDLDVLWESGDRKLLKLSIKDPQLHIRSRKAPSPDGFVPHWSKLTDAKIQPSLLVWNKGLIEEFAVPKNEPVSITNVKKGIASAFQFQMKEESTELDASGKCNARYISQSPTTILKVKSDCISDDFQYIRNPDELLQVQVDSSRQITFELDSSNPYFKAVKCKETHTSKLSMNEGIGSQVEVELNLAFKRAGKVAILKEDTIESVVQKIEKTEGVTFTRETLLTEKDFVADSEKATFTKLVSSLRSYLSEENSGKLKSAKAFLKLVKAARSSTKEDIAKSLGSSKNKEILPQLLDILGNVQTKDSHSSVMKVVHFDKEEQLDLSERYLWSLSFSSQPNPDIIEHLLKKYAKTLTMPSKVKETLILTIASMTYRLRRLSQNSLNNKLIQEVENTLLNHLEYNKGEDRLPYFRALQNLKSSSTIPALLSYIKDGTQKEGVLAWKAIRSFDSNNWNKDVLRTAQKSLFQLDRRYDSSSRTIAADVLLESSPSDETLRNLLSLLMSDDPAFEVKQYVLQRIRMIADADQDFGRRVRVLIRQDSRLNNYSTLSPRGMSIALARRFVNGASSNGSLVTVQEMKSGIVKRGAVNVVLEKNDVTKEIFSLGIFSGGLSSFMSDSESEEESKDEPATAGIELAVLDTQVRPFVFFSGQGELMGHVWSGTASELTPAFQVLLMLQDHSESIRLGSGFIASLDVKGATSLDLSGKIEISLWNRNAESVVKKSAGMMTAGTMTVDTMFVKSQVEFSASVAAELNLQSDIEFSSKMRACMRLTQPDSMFRHNIFKIERIPGSKHSLRISKYKKSNVHGTTYQINKKNNEMCSAMFS